MANERIGIDLEARDRASATIQRVKKSLDSLEKAAGATSGGFRGLGKAAGYAALAVAAIKAGEAAFELAKLGAESLRLKASFTELAQEVGISADDMLSAMQRASHGTITEYDLMLNANRALVLGVADTTDEMTALLEFSRRASVRLGTSLQFAFESLVTGIGRTSPLLLDNVGISLNNISVATEKYAVSIGKAVDDLDDMERKQALVNAVIEDNKRAMEGANVTAGKLAGDGFAQLGAAWDDFRRTIGTSFAPFLDDRASEIAEFIKKSNALLKGESLDVPVIQDQILPTIKLWQSHIENVRKDIEDINAQIAKEQREGVANQLAFNPLLGEEEARNIVAKNIEGWRLVIVNLEEDIASTQDKIRNLASLLDTSMGSLADAIRPTAEQIAATNQAILELAGGAEGAAGKFATFEQSFEQAAQILADSKSKIDSLYGTLLDTGKIDEAGQAFGTLQTYIQEVVAEWIRQGHSIEEIQGVLLPKLVSELNRVLGAEIEAAQAGQQAGVDIGDGFLAALPGIETLVTALLGLLGVVQEVGGATDRAIARAGALSSARAGNVLERFRPREAPSRTPETFPSTQVPRPDRFGGLGRAVDLAPLHPRGIGVGRLQAIPGIGGGGGGISDAERQFNALASKLESTLKGALSSGIDLSAILPREDAIEEPARRLADIAVRGFDSPWVDYIKNTFPELWAQIESSNDPKQAAAQILKDFEDGLRPELLDKERAKELVKRAILGDQNIAQLSQEIAQELSQELGISLQDAQAAASGVLGGGDGAGAGLSKFGDGAVGAVTDGNVGGRMVAALVAQLKLEDNLTLVYSAGETYGSQWGSGFMATVQTNVPVALINLLTVLVTPAVQQALAQQGTRTGAVAG